MDGDATDEGDTAAGGGVASAIEGCEIMEVVDTLVVVRNKYHV